MAEVGATSGMEPIGKLFIPFGVGVVFQENAFGHVQNFSFSPTFPTLGFTRLKQALEMSPQGGQGEDGGVQGKGRIERSGSAETHDCS